MNNFAVLTISYSHTATSIIITITTNTPCHLTCYYTDKEPGSHRTSRNQRGLTLPWGVYYCFVSWLSVEQTEAGDTLTHTFLIPAWVLCQTKWLAFRGTVSTELSPSVSPIFKHHHIGPQLTKYEFYDTGDNAGYFYREEAWAAQTFTPTIPHKITKVTLLLLKSQNPTAPLIISIRATDTDGKPTGADLCSGTLDTATLTTSPVWRDITLGDGTLLSASVKYAIVFRCPLTYFGNMPGWRARYNGGYPTGELADSYNAGTTWWIHPQIDFMFQEWGYPT